MHCRFSIPVLFYPHSIFGLFSGVLRNEIASPTSSSGPRVKMWIADVRGGTTARLGDNPIRILAARISEKLDVTWNLELQLINRFDLNVTKRCAQDSYLPVHIRADKSVSEYDAIGCGSSSFDILPFDPSCSSISSSISSLLSVGSHISVFHPAL